MEKLIILRMFFYFPLLGLLLPDAGVLLAKAPGRVPLIHVGIEIGLIFCILICTAAIAIMKKRNSHAADRTNEALYS
jgi:hypothetical protein